MLVLVYCMAAAAAAKSAADRTLNPVLPVETRNFARQDLSRAPEMYFPTRLRPLKVLISVWYIDTH